MNKSIALILAASAIFLAGCSSPVRTLELKQVSSTTEKNELRKAGWKFKGVIVSRPFG